MDTVVLILRVLLSLAVVLGLLWVLQRRFAGSGAASTGGVPLTVLSRRNIGAKAAVVVVETDGKRFLLGVTEQSVNVLHTSDAPVPVPVSEGAEVFARSLQEAGRRDATSGKAGAHGAGADDAVTAPALYPLPGGRRARRRPEPPLAGSILSAGTWRQTAAALRQVTQR
ncbi:FliO/MopB family protein [Arthrobacter mobilis]|uniref:FliO/MopB family protein n=1 Tax=Arthrobacter mobilis TaxID=2724944 RepID=A0A7X6K4Z1_9MICC|nr:flagellar biosynthetic protein FliO [Arthrobacter mobilis]NKX53634.1 FliO/MopB family protein [Arthrobacter mobilis]